MKKDRKQYSKEYREKNKERIRGYATKDIEKTKAYMKEYHKSYKQTEKSKQHKKEYQKEYRKTPEFKEKQRIRRSSEEFKARRNLYRKSSSVKKTRNESIKNRNKTDVQFKLSRILRVRLYSALHDNLKNGSAVRDLGCDTAYLKLYLESKFYQNPLTGDQMSWENHGNGKGKWQIDHIEELHTVDLSNRDDLLRVCNFKNLQPLWHEDHVNKRGKRNEPSKSSSS